MDGQPTTVPDRRFNDRTEGGRMKAIMYRGTRYPCPLSGEFRRHTDEERAAMRKSVAEIGVRQAVRLYRDADSGEVGVLDGEGRLETAAELDADVPFVDDGEMTFDAAFRVARGLNDARRHDERDAIRLREERVKRVLAKRAEGKSTRVIAEEEGVSQPQVLRDIKAATDTSPVSVAELRDATAAGDSEPNAPVPDPVPLKVVGRNGKKYAARKPQKTAPPAKGPNSPRGPGSAGPESATPTTCSAYLPPLFGNAPEADLPPEPAPPPVATPRKRPTWASDLRHFEYRCGEFAREFRGLARSAVPARSAAAVRGLAGRLRRLLDELEQMAADLPAT